MIDEDEELRRPWRVVYIYRPLLVGLGEHHPDCTRCGKRWAARFTYEGCRLDGWPAEGAVCTPCLLALIRHQAGRVGV